MKADAGVIGGPIRQNRRVLAAAMVGSTVEYYDFFIYGTAAALVFGPLFFPGHDPAAQVMLSLLTFGIAFVARPVGAILFGHFGDRIGRKSTLIFALMTMGVSTLCIAFLPTYAQAGWIAPALLCLLRFGQGLGIGGEWGGAALLAVENAPPGWVCRFGAAPQLGAPIGMFMANGLFLLLGMAMTPEQFLAWGWRLPFLLSAVLVGLGLWIRLKISETPAFKAALEREPHPHVPIATLVREHPRGLIGGSAGAVATFAAFYLATAFALAMCTGQLGYEKTPFLAMQLLSNVFYGIGIVAGARRADATSPGAVIGAGALGLALCGLFFGPGLAFGGIGLAGVTVCLVMLVLGYNNATLGPWLATLFPVRLRYSGASFGFTFGGMIGGAVSPLIAQKIASSGHPGLTGLLLTAAGIITWAGTRFGRPITSRTTTP